MGDQGKSQKQTGRSKRLKKRKSYGGEEINDDEIDGKWNFNLDEKLSSPKYNDKVKFYIELNGSDVTLSYFQKHGFSTPLLVKEKTGLGMRIPSENFTVTDVQRCVGSRRVLDVMDVKSQKGLEMTVKEWVKYYENKEEHDYHLLNVISLEFSHTRLEDYVDQPRVVHEMDWVDTAWPWYYKELQTQSTNILDGMMYPKVQKYCLMSVEGCYTDFHIDMSGTSVWYHILHGKKIFWLIAPSEENLSMYVSWTLSTKQNDIFFGDLVKTCHRITLEAGSTFFIPTGWIHAVYTPADSLVFGGNFLHSYSMPMQLRIADIEAKTHVPLKFRYPFFKELHWYVLERYISCLTGKEHRIRSDQEIRAENGELDVDDANAKTEQNDPLVFASMNPIDMKAENSPECFMEDDADIGTQPIMDMYEDDVSLSLLCDEEEVSMSHNNVRTARVCLNRTTSSSFQGSDSMLTSKSSAKSQCSTGGHLKMSGVQKEIRKASGALLTPYELEGLEAVIRWLECLPTGKRNVPKDIPEPDQLLADARMLLKVHMCDDPKQAVTGNSVLQWPPRKQVKHRKPKAPAVKSSAAANGKARRRRVRCRRCEPCTREDCRECRYCLDQKKYGGPQRLKKACISRNCLAPMLSKEATCELCGNGDVDHDWMDVTDEDEWSQWLMECRICYSVVHPACLRQQCPDNKHNGVFDEDFPSSWDCASCCEQGLQGKCRPRYTNIKMLKEHQSNSPDRGSASRNKSFQSRNNSNNLTHSKFHGETSAGLQKSEPVIRLMPVDIKKPRTDTPQREHTSSKDSSWTVARNKKLHQSGSASVHHSVKRKAPECNGASFDLVNFEIPPVRVNSRGREITLPRRYLL